MAKITINEGLSWLKTLRERQKELVSLRDANSARERRYIGHTDKEIVKEALYDPKKLDLLIGGVAKEIRLLDTAIKKQNATTVIDGYDQNEAALGTLE